MYKYIFLAILIFLTGCSTKNTIENMSIEENDVKNENFTTRDYTNISKDAVFEAAKKVFLLASKKEFRIDSYRDKLLVSKTKMTFIPLMVDVHEDFWQLSIEEENNISKAKLELFRIYDYNNEEPKFLTKNIHDLLWTRIDYILGLNDIWMECKDHNLDFYGALCDPIDMHDLKRPIKEDIIQDILISDRKLSQSLNDIDDDILNDDVELTIDDEEDILSKDDSDSKDEDNEETKSDADFDRELKELEKKVNKNIDETLDKIENNVNDEVIENVIE